MKPINIKNMMALIEKEPDDQYIPVLKPVLMQALTEIKQLRRKNSQLGGKVARGSGGKGDNAFGSVSERKGRT